MFPGVGAFQSAIDGLTSRGLLEPLRQYIQSGKPYFGICIGMQVLFQSSAESPSTPGLGIIPQTIERFDDTEKSVPHMGWNSLELLDESPEDSSPHYYFVHSYRAKYDPANSKWAHAISQYGDELFIASVRKDNIYAVQFHPEKSGSAGLKFVDTWLRQTFSKSHYHPSSRIPRTLKPKHGLTKRIIACMDVRTNDQGDLVVTKGDQYDVREKNTVTAGAVRNLGKPVSLTARYAAAGADEVVLLNITSFRHSPLLDQPMLAVVLAASEEVFVPLTIGGGIKDSVDPDGTKRSALEVAGAYFRAGADKVSIGSEAVYAVEKLRAQGTPKGDSTSAIETIAHAYGRQAVVVSIDPRRVYVEPEYNGPHRNEIIHGGDGKAWWYQCTVSGGRESRPLSVIQLAQGVETLGAGEILLNSIDRDGTGLGFDLDLIALVRASVRIPVVASSGAGAKEHFVEVFDQTGVEAALAAGIFHRNEVEIADVKEALRVADINVRLTGS